MQLLLRSSLDSVMHGYSKKLRDFVWVDDKGVWDTPHLTKVLTRESAACMGCRITVQDYRHIAIAIDRVYVRGLASDIKPQEDDPHDAMANHGTTTADQVYGIDRSMLRGLSIHSTTVFRGVADRWHRFLRLNSCQIPDHSSRRRTHSKIASISSLELPQSKKQQQDTLEQQHTMTTTDWNSTLQEAMDTFIGPGATFRSLQQRESLLAVLQGESPLVVILPTGGGKSLLFMLPATLPDARTTIVVVPFVTLLEDLLQKCRSTGISCMEWKEDYCTSKATIVFVAAETAAQKPFFSYANDLQLRGQLDRIFIDECHLILTAASYRVLLPQLEQLRLVPCPLILLTATLPPCMEEDLNKAMCLAGVAEVGELPIFPTYIRAPTHRPNFVYRVESHVGSQLEDRVCQLLQEAQQKLQEEEKAVLFCRNRYICERMAWRLGCQPYHSTWTTKKESLAAWVAGNTKISVATGALGSGIDVAGIRLIVHLGRPRDILDYAQEAGRGSRQDDRTKCISTIVLSQTELNWLRSHSTTVVTTTAVPAVTAVARRELDLCQVAMQDYITTTSCRRLALSRFLDTQARSCSELEAELCDNCFTATKATVDSNSDHSRKAQNLPMNSNKQLPPAVLQATFKDKAYYTQGIKLREARVRTEAEQIRRFEKTIYDIAGQCPACWLMHSTEDSASHSIDQCTELSMLLDHRLSYREVRQLVRYTKNSCCFKCSLPGDWCEAYQNRRSCKSPDIIFPLALIAWLWKETRGLVTPVARCEFGLLEEYVNWLSQPRRMYGTNSTNAMAAAEIAIEYQRKGSYSSGMVDNGNRSSGNSGRGKLGC